MQPGAGTVVVVVGAAVVVAEARAGAGTMVDGVVAGISVVVGATSVAARTGSSKGRTLLSTDDPLHDRRSR
ncbi:MAG: hypothetical protein CL442_03190 [Acidimicrobiaceae bacterium]|nr:hypothetical protein [Acidimicrobiaceae bacterium]